MPRLSNGMIYARRTIAKGMLLWREEMCWDFTCAPCMSGLDGMERSQYEAFIRWVTDRDVRNLWANAQRSDPMRDLDFLSAWIRQIESEYANSPQAYFANDFSYTGPTLRTGADVGTWTPGQWADEPNVINWEDELLSIPQLATAPPVPSQIFEGEDWTEGTPEPRSPRYNRRSRRRRTVPENASSYNTPRYSPDIRTKQGEVIMEIDEELKKELVKKIEIPNWILGDVYYIRKVVSNPQHAGYKKGRHTWWKNHTIAQWQKLLMETPVDDWLRETYIGVADDGKTLAIARSGDSLPRYTEYLESLVGLVSKEVVDSLLGNINIRRGYRLARTESGNILNYTLRVAMTTNSRYKERLESVLRMALDDAGSNTLSIGPDGAYGYQLSNLIKLVETLGANFQRYYVAVGGKAASYEHPVERHDTSRQFVDFFSRRANKFDYSESVESLLIAPHGTKASRNWGIEVESGGSRGIGAPRGWDRKYDGSLSSAYYYTDTPEVTFEEGDYGDCGEFVSPILKSFHSKGLETLLKKLATQPQNDSAGVHVHVDVPDLTPKQVGAAVWFYEFIEPLVEEYYKRETRQYCEPRNSSEVLTTIRSTKRAQYKAENDANYINSDRRYQYNSDVFIQPGGRYHSLNLCSLSSHGTIEFRAMGPVYDYEHLIKWAHFVREVVNCAKNGIPVKAITAIRSFADIRQVFALYGTETSETVFRSITEDVSEQITADV